MPFRVVLFKNYGFLHETFWTDREDKNIGIDSRFYSGGEIH